MNKKRKPDSRNLFFASRLREERNQRGWSRDKFCDEYSKATNGCAISSASVYNWENGLQYPKKEQMNGISKTLGLDESAFSPKEKDGQTYTITFDDLSFLREVQDRIVECVLECFAKRETEMKKEEDDGNYF